MTVRVIGNFKAAKTIAGVLMALALLSACATMPGPGRGLAAPFTPALIRESFPRRETVAGYDCPTPPVALRALTFSSYYRSDSRQKDVVDDDAFENYRRALAPLTQFEQKIVSLANAYLRSNPPRPALAQCVQTWLAEWAQAGALLGEVNPTGEAVRKWALASIAAAWLQVRDDPALDLAGKRLTERWIDDLARAVRDDYSRLAENNTRQNNHLYWAAWAVGLASVALDDRALFDWALVGARAGIGEIALDGTLPLEMARGRRALRYHLFAATPLFLLADLAQRNGVDLYGENDAGLDRLARRLITALDDDTYFVAEAGTAQEALSSPGTHMAWLFLYNKRHPSAAAAALLRRYEPVTATRAGGDIALLYGRR